MTLPDSVQAGDSGHVRDHNAIKALLDGKLSTAVSPALATYTGRRGTSGSGPDARAAIQAALNQASSLADSSWYSYLTRRGEAVVLPPGQYVLTAPSDGSPSLTVPAGVHLDTSQAQLYFDYPATTTGSWAGILVKNGGSLRVGYMTPSGRNAPPDATTHLYDGVRLLGNDNAMSPVTGYADSEIRAFDGASIRGIGAWVQYVSGIKLSSRFGYIASAWPTSNAYGYAHPAGMPTAGLSRGHNDLYLTDCYFNENIYGGFIGTTSGAPGSPNDMDYTSGALQVYFTRCVFEYFDAFAMHVTGYCVSLTDCAFEEVGSGNGMAWLDTVRSAVVSNLRVNYTGVPVPTAAGGTATPTNSFVFKNTNVQAFDMVGGYIHNTYLAAMKLASAAASRYRIGPIYADAHPLADGPMASPVITGVKATRTVDQTGLTNAAFTVIDFTGTDAWDSDAYHDPATNPSRITIPLGRPGRYVFTAKVPLASNTTGRRIIRLLKNGATLESVDTAPVTGGPSTLTITVEDVAAVGDYYQIAVFQDSGGALPTDVTSRACNFTARLVQ